MLASPTVQEKYNVSHVYSFNLLAASKKKGNRGIHFNIFHLIQYIYNISSLTYNRHKNIEMLYFSHAKALKSGVCFTPRAPLGLDQPRVESRRAAQRACFQRKRATR